MRLSKIHRNGVLPRLLGLLLLCNGILHLAFHDACCAKGSAVGRGNFEAAVAAVDVSSESEPELASESFCPCCSAAIDWWCESAVIQRFSPSDASAELSLTRTAISSAPNGLPHSRAPPRG